MTGPIGSPSLRDRLRRGLRRGGHTCFVLFRVSVPTFIVMELLRRLGIIESIGRACAPFMAVFRLPGEAAIPVLLGYLVNVYTATAALGSLGLSGGQVMTLGLMLGMAHQLVVETTVLKAAGARALRLLAYRLVMSFVVGWAASRLFIGPGRTTPGDGGWVGGGASGAESIAGAALGAALSAALFSLQITLVLVPALVLYDLLAPLPVFARWGRAIGPWLSRLGMSPPCAVPLAAGFFIGIAYGAGIIIPIAEEKRIGPEELHCLGLFLCTCHAVIEDTFLFALVGASGPREIAQRMLLLAGLRLSLALAVLGGRRALVRGKNPAPGLV